MFVREHACNAGVSSVADREGGTYCVEVHITYSGNRRLHDVIELHVSDASKFAGACHRCVQRCAVSCMQLVPSAPSK